MKARELFSRILRPAMSCALLGKALVVATTTSRSQRKPEREARGGLNRKAFALTLSLVVLINLGSPHFGFAKLKNRTEEIAAEYSINRTLEESDGIQIRRKLLKLLSMPKVRLFLEVIQKAEGGQPNLMVGGCRANTLTQHPGMMLPSKCWYRIKLDGRWRYSTASGNYQITLSNWKEIAPFLGLRDFSETSQALAALELIRRGGGAAKASTPSGLAMKRRIQKGFMALLLGNLKSALCLATYDWASSTCSPFPASFKVNYVKLSETMRRSSKASDRKGAK